MNLIFSDNHVFIQTNDKWAKNVLKDWFNAQDLKKGYRIPKNIWSLRELIKVFPDLKNHQQLIDEGKRLKDEMDHLLTVRKYAATAVPRNTKLRPYQGCDVVYLKKLPAAGLFNEPRTGKTPTVITLLKELGKKRNLIVCPASLIWNWQKEFIEWFPKCETYTVYGSTSNRMKIYDVFGLEASHSKVLIISKDTLKNDIDKHALLKEKFNTCTVDEAHFLRNYKTAQSKAVFSIKAERRYALSGTPTLKHPSDIWGIIHFLYPHIFNSYWHFVDRYFDQSNDWMGHVVVGDPKKHRLQELQEMIGLMSVQRKRKEVMPWLPEKQRSTFTLRLEGKQKKLYDEMANFFLASDGNTEVDTSNIITQLMRLRQLCLDPRLLGFDTPGVKTEALLEYLENHQEPIVIMSWFTSYLKLLQPLIEKLGLKVGMIHGEMSNAQKHDSATRFQNNERTVLLCNIISAGTGFTLDRASTIIFTDKDFTPALNEQAEDRICSTTEAKIHKHEIITIACANSIDEKIFEILDRKEDLAAYINKGGVEAIKKLLGG